MRRTLLTSIVLGVALASTTSGQRNTSAWAEAVHKRWTAELESNSALLYNTSAILVRFDSDKDEAYKANVRALLGDGWLERYTLVPGLELVHERGSVTEAVARAKPFVLYAEPDYVERATNTPNDPRFNLEWGLQNTGQVVNGIAGTADADIRATQAWDVFTGDPNFVIADLDSGMQYTHPDLAANVWTNPGEIPDNGIDDDGDGFIDDVHGWDFYSNDNDPADANGHGTHTAGTIGARGDNGVGITGVNWRCKLMAPEFGSWVLMLQERTRAPSRASSTACRIVSRCPTTVGAARPSAKRFTTRSTTRNPSATSSCARPGTTAPTSTARRTIRLRSISTT